MPRRDEIHLDDELAVLLKDEAARQGIDPEVLAGQLIRQELERRTRPRKTRGTVTPFRRKT